ncbi:MAG: Ni/Fe hydrogenase subunit alpha [Myxococcaceae bacterium]|nr:Ni/Fe hydrogenase subunit alpha [Myxococcaceae bacterium]
MTTPASKTRRIAIDPLTRVEGHGKVTLLLDEHAHVTQARLHVVEFRGFERFIEGRPYWEVPVMVQRLCGICPVSHHLAASKALDAVVGAAPVSPTADRVRRLMHYGQVLQSHALHFFHLASPDLLFGFDAAPERRSIAALAAELPEVARQGVLLRRFGQECIRLTAGKRVHGTGSVPGGVNKAVTPAERAALKADLPQVLAFAREGVARIAELYGARRAELEAFGTAPSGLLSLVGRDGRLELYDGVLRARDAHGAVLLDGVDPARYREHIAEGVKSWSYMKFPYLVSRGPDSGSYKVGPLARLQNCDFIHTPLAEAERAAFVAEHGGRPVHAPLAYHHARLIELLHAAEVIGELLDDPDLSGDDLLRKGPRATEGVGVIEAPRGTLIHHYRVSPDDLVTHCNLIVSTTHNNQPMNDAIREVARTHLDGHEPTEGLLNHLEVAIRAFDPCLSCASHALGQMPLHVEVRGPGGALLGSRTKESRG